MPHDLNYKFLVNSKGLTIVPNPKPVYVYTVASPDPEDDVFVTEHWGNVLNYLTADDTIRIIAQADYDRACGSNAGHVDNEWIEMYWEEFSLEAGYKITKEIKR